MTSRQGVHARLRASARFGLTLVELLIALAVLSLMLAATAALIVGSARTQQAVDTQIRRTSTATAVTELITYEVALAGYSGTAAVPVASSGSSVEVVLGTAEGVSDSITVRFLEDAFLGGEDDGQRLITYRVNADGQLVREADGESSVLVDGVVELRVLEFIGRDRSVTSAAPGAVLPAEVAGIRVEVRFLEDQTWTFLVGLYNRQSVVVL